MADQTSTRSSAPASAPTLPAAIADAVPLGLAAFALTTFLWSAQNAGWTRGTDAWLAYAFAYGGFCQLLAGMWEFRNRNVFGATVFSTYAGFWLGLALYTQFVATRAGTTPAAVNNDLAWIMVAFAVFNTYMLLWSTQVNEAVLAVFLALEITEIVLAIGYFTSNSGTITLGGYLGILTALCAWYASAAGVINGMLGKAILKVGRPLGLPGGHAARTHPIAH